MAKLKVQEYFRDRKEKKSKKESKMTKDQEYFRDPAKQKPNKLSEKVTGGLLEEGGVYKFTGGKFVLVQEGPKVDIHITPGTVYKSRDGRPVRIYEVNAGSVDFPVIGAIKDENDHWQPRVYNEIGISKRPYGEGNDIVSEWSET